ARPGRSRTGVRPPGGARGRPAGALRAGRRPAPGPADRRGPDPRTGRAAAVRGPHRMNVPTAYFFFRCLVRETFRQALAARTFWLMLAVSAVSIVLCLSVRIEGGESLKPPSEIELVGRDKKP